MQSIRTIYVFLQPNVFVMKNFFLIVLVFVFIVPGIYAQKKKLRPMQKDHSSQMILKAYEDSLVHAWNRNFSALDSFYTDSVQRNIELNPRYNRLFLPLTYYYAPVKQAFDPGWKPNVLSGPRRPSELLFPVDYAALNQTELINRRVNHALLALYVAHPELVQYTERQIMQRQVFRKEIEKKLPPKIKVIDLFNPEPVESNVGTAELFIKKPNFWTFGGVGALQFTQNFISKNWYKGGESSNAMLSNIKFTANFDDKQRIEFENSLEIKLGFMTTPSDTVHKYKTNSDLFRIYSKLGYKAFDRWYYAATVEFTTQFFSNYKTNTNIKQVGFFSPATLKAGVGLDYKLNKKKINLSVMLSPFAYNYVYIADPDVDPTAFGIKEGKHILHEFGSTFQTTMKWEVIPSIIWESRLSYFTNYKKVQAEWENTINFVLNRYLSTQVFFHARFDDGVKPLDDHSYFQFKELLSFGLNYVW